MLTKKHNDYYSVTFDNTNCDEEPISIIRCVQPYGKFLVCDHKLEKWYYASEDIEEDLENISVKEYLKKHSGLSTENLKKYDSKIIDFTAYEFVAIVHNKSFGYIIELEPRVDIGSKYSNPENYQDVILALSKKQSFNQFFSSVVNEVYNMTGYDHVMIYKFEEDHSGIVIAEKKHKDITSYLGLHFPKGDIPKQARDLYFKEGIRTIFSTSLPQKFIIRHKNHSKKTELDLTGITMRGVSPIHIQYLSNMKVISSFSVAIIYEDKLWGLVACHNKSEKLIDYKRRKWLKFLSTLISMNLDKLNSFNKDISKLNEQLISQNLLDKVLVAKDLVEGFLKEGNALTKLISADGLIIKSNDIIHTKSEVPEKNKVTKLFKWLENQDPFDVKQISKSKDILDTDIYDPLWAGMLIIQFSKLSSDYIIWTRKEKTIKVSWGGNPKKNKTFDEEKGMLLPRNSFQKWEESVQGSSESWNQNDINIAKRFKAEIREHLYKKYNEVSLLNQELKNAYAEMESFSCSVSHDLKAPLRSIEGFAQILKEDYSNVLDKNGLHLLDIITESIYKMNIFINDILKYSKLNRGSLDIIKIDLNELITITWNQNIKLWDENRIGNIEINNELPTVYGDYTMISQLISNLISNSLKFVLKGEKTYIKIWSETKEGFVNIFFHDKGIGIPSNHRQKVFKVFKRLVRDEDYEGTGIGMSIMKKVIERHGCKIQVLPPLYQGALIQFSLPTNHEFVSIMEARNDRV